MDPRLYNRLVESLSARISSLEKMCSNLPVRWAVPQPAPAITIVQTDAPFTSDAPGADPTDHPGGFYIGRALSGSASSAGDDAQAQSDLDMPEGMSVPPNDQKIVILNLSEDNLDANTHCLFSPSFHIALKVGTWGHKNSKGEVTNTLDVYAIEAADPFAVFVVTLAPAASPGSNGTQTTPATWAYDVTNLAGRKLGTGMTPQVARPNGTCTQASFGLGYFGAPGGPSRAFLLLYAFEVPGTSSCPA